MSSQIPQRNPRWKFFDAEPGCFVFHTPTASILQLPKNLWQDLQKESSDKNLDILENFTKNLTYKNTYPKNEESRIRHIALNVAERCNMRCSYCYAGEGDYGSNTLMSFDTASRAIRYFSRRGEPLHVSFFGGEPLLNFKLITEIVEWCEREKISCSYSITTNALLLNERHIEFFKRHSISMKISYDGKETQPLQRKAIDPMEKNLEIEHKFNLLERTEIKSTISRKNLSYFASDLLHTLNTTDKRVHYTRVASSREEDVFKKEDIEQLGSQLNELFETLIQEKSWDKILRISNLRIYLKDIKYGLRRPFCGAGLNYLSVSTSGKFYLCHRFTEDEEQCLGDLEKGLDERRLEEVRGLRRRSQEPCSSCWMQHFCKGGCFHEHKMGTEKIDNIDPIFCQLQDIEMSLALKLFVILQRESPESFREL